MFVPNWVDFIGQFCVVKSKGCLEKYVMVEAVLGEKKRKGYGHFGVI